MAEFAASTGYRRRQLLHAQLVRHLPTVDWDMVATNLDRIETAIHGDLAIAALNRWRDIVATHDAAAAQRAFLDNSESADLMRVVSPFAGILSAAERQSVIDQVRADSGRRSDAP